MAANAAHPMEDQNRRISSKVRHTLRGIAPESVKRLYEKVREHQRAGRGHSLPATIRALNPLLRGVDELLSSDGS